MKNSNKEKVAWLCMSWSLVMLLCAVITLMLGMYWIAIGAFLWAAIEMAGVYYFYSQWYCVDKYCQCRQCKPRERDIPFRSRPGGDFEASKPWTITFKEKWFPKVQKVSAKLVPAREFDPLMSKPKEVKPIRKMTLREWWKYHVLKQY